MADPVSVPQSWFAIVAGALGSLLTGNFVYFHRKVDRMDSRMNQVHKTFVTHEQLGLLEKRLEDRANISEIRKENYHTQNLENFREVRLLVEGINTKLFELASKK